jgi:hypothetical protein
MTSRLLGTEYQKKESKNSEKAFEHPFMIIAIMSLSMSTTSWNSWQDALPNQDANADTVRKVEFATYRPQAIVSSRSPRRVRGRLGGTQVCWATELRRKSRTWSTFGPHAIGTERFATVSSGASFAQVAGGILGKQALVQNPDEVPGSSPGRPTQTSP